ncbi:hypothetical protein Pcinc_023698 [Petrolisthes cinctipes]|uniref:Nicastrin n=1 Tax=Petrolisthes cinctipes TaxID=88211 RepID=A0AAE1FCL9_PETCI|nr:hypothetical protein Pcinc_023698 [Petrolisthes cinctipes]
MAATCVRPSPLTMFWCYCFYITTFLTLVHGDRVMNKIYVDIQGDMACFKRFNGTHEIGCTSGFYGNSGVIHVIQNQSDLQWVYDKGPHKPYVLAIPPQFHTPQVLKQAEDSGKVSGIVVMVEENFNPQVLGEFSGESHCPNSELDLYKASFPEYSGYCEKNPWNPDGTSFLFMSWNFPVFLVDNQTSIDYIKQYYEDFNKPDENGEPQPWPLLCMELNSNMFGTTNAEVCMRRSNLAGSQLHHVNFCDPLSDRNILATLNPMNASVELPEKSVTVVAARMDATSMFDNISPGANSAVSGLVTLLVAADALNRYKDAKVESSTKNILFVLFQGESWGYIGSSRMVWDMARGEFPFKYQENLSDQMSQINLTHIEHFIELNQVGEGMRATDSLLFLHTDPVSNSDPQISSETRKLLTLLQNSSSVANSSVTLEEVKPEIPLPPASFQSFLKKENISGIVITDHKEGFKNKFYQNIFDDYKNVKYEADGGASDRYHKHISHVASALATTLYTILTDEVKPITVNETLADTLLYCYMQNISCEMFKKFGEKISPSFFNEKPAKMYVSVGENNGLTYLTEKILAGLVGEKVDLDSDSCKVTSRYSVYQLFYSASIDNGTCFQSTVRGTVAQSPAFSIEGYDWQSGEYSTWTESGWQMTGLMIYLKPSVGEEVGLVCGGVVSLLLSLGVVYFMNSRADIIFGLPTPPAAC